MTHIKAVDKYYLKSFYVRTYNKKYKLQILEYNIK